MNGGGSQSPSYNMGGNSSGFSGGGYQSSSGYAPWSSSGSQPFQMQSYTPQSQQGWASMSPSYNTFSQMAAQGQQTPLANQAGVNTALAQPAATLGVAPQQNFTLADANVTAGLPATGMPQPVAPTPAPPPSAAPVTPAQAIRVESARSVGKGQPYKYILSDGRTISEGDPMFSYLSQNKAQQGFNVSGWTDPYA